MGPDVVIDGYKRAAARLYGLVEADRKWLLGQLGPAHREKLSRLLAELDDLHLDEASLRTIITDMEAGQASPADERASLLPRALIDELDAVPVALVSKNPGISPSMR